jgi:hypothetical protein
VRVQLGTPVSIAPKALLAMRSLGKRFSSVQLRVGAPQSSQCSSGFHKPASSGAAPETATSLRQGFGLGSHLASPAQQPANRNPSYGFNGVSCNFHFGRVVKREKKTPQIENL